LTRHGVNELSYPLTREYLMWLLVV